MPKKPRPPPKPRKCPGCNGSRKQWALIDSRWLPVTCTVCKGTGVA